ncbi:extracellular electron transfer flavoprotein PplA [Vagococcus elongatus]|uniref:FMN-binding protein n=1 Tax=Vagococcus elongatus TaxID=180344 RepID=A0A430AV08_9ENTE|nr:extracellular electron transfer flavoprotein PplA [Vagococcus elongatus]RSU11892.1 FMN-binding protein [Vagococcus elongatus]
MKKTRFLSGVALIAVSGMLFVGCQSDDAAKDKTEESTVETAETSEKEEAKQVAGAPLKDGTFTLEEKNYSNDYRATFSITVKDGKITESNFDNVNADGESKKDNEEYNETMKEKSGTGPAEFIPKLNELFVDAQNAGGIDIEAVTGATHSARSFVNYAQQLVQAAQAGNTETIEINNGGELQDGTYTLEEKNYSNGYRVVFSITVEGNKITESNYDYVDADGKSKIDDQEYNEKMKEIAGTNAEEFIPKFNEGLVQEQVPSEIDVVTGATHSFNAFQMYAEQLINAAEKGNTDKIEVDNIVFE